MNKNVDTRWPAQKKLLMKLSLFNDKANEIKDDFFDKKGFISKHKKILLTLKENSTKETQVFLINEERLKSIILSFRFFFQKKDCSFKQMKNVYDALDIHDDYKRMYSYIKEHIDNFLDSYDDFYEEVNSKIEKFTNKEIIDVFFYGKYAHVKPKEKKIYDMWDKDPRILGMHQTIFVMNLYFLAGVIQVIKRMNHAAIETFDSKNFLIRDFKNVIKDLNKERFLQLDQKDEITD